MKTSDDINWRDPIEPEGILVFSPERKITFVNEYAENITGFNSDRVLNDNYRLLFQDVKKFNENLSKTLEAGKSFSNWALNIFSANRKTIDVVASLIPITLSNSIINGAVFIFHDRRKRRALYDLLEEKTWELINERNKLEAVFNSRMEAITIIDKNCKITAFNHSAEKITGYSSTEAIGRKCWDILNSYYCQNDCPIGRCKEFSQITDITKIKELYTTRKDGQKVPVRLTLAPLLNKDREHIGAVETFQDISELKNLNIHLEERFRLYNIIGRSSVMEKIYRLIENVSKTDSTILITGESGTGKELVARAIHLNSYRRLGPFVAINCSAFSENLLESELFGHEKGAFTGAIQTKQGRFEIVQRGTLFLDEIGDISPSVQVKLLRVLETRQFERVGSNKPIKMDCRIITATNKNLTSKLGNDFLRDDFYYRINVINIALPSLRERIDDLPLLLQNLMENYSLKFKRNISSISPSALNLLKSYNWPGNIRELENVMEHAFVMCHGEVIEPEHLPEKFSVGSGIDDISLEIGTPESLLRNAEKILISNTLKKFGGHRGNTAKALRIDKSTLWRKMKKFELL